MLNPSIFRAYDIRGIFPKELNESAAYQIGRAFAVYLKETEPEKPEKIIIGRDTRVSSPILSRSFISGVIREGIDVLDIGFVTVDAVYFASGSMRLPAVMITASHNPKEWNGFKLMKKDAEVLGGEELLKIKTIADLKNWPEERETPGYEAGSLRPEGKVAELDNHADFIRHVLNFIDADAIKPMNIVVDASSGAAGPVLKKILEGLPIEYTALHFEPDGDFPYHEPDPTKEKNLEVLKNELLMHHYHFGCAFDGDGDRIIFVDGSGETVNPSIIGAIMARFFLKRNPGAKIIYGATVSNIVSDIINLYGGAAVREKVGHTNIAKRMRKENGAFGIETSGHYYFKNNFYADSGIISFLTMLAILSNQNKSLSALASEFKKYVSMPEMSFEIENPEEFLKQIAPNFEGYDTDWLDGLTVRTGDFWLNLRPSNTEPLVRLNIEAKNGIILERVKRDFLDLLGRLKT